MSYQTKEIELFAVLFKSGYIKQYSEIILVSTICMKMHIGLLCIPL